ncbi:MAG: hypothetical protein U0P45_15475 [Acidimicrobiales bacterium]
MKRSRTLPVALVLALTLGACGTSGGEKATPTTRRATTTTEATTTTRATTTTEATTTTTDTGWTVNSVEAWVALYQEDLQKMLDILERTPASLDIGDDAAVASFGSMCKDLGAWADDMATSAMIPDAAAEAQWRGMLEDTTSFTKDCTAAIATKDAPGLVEAMQHYNDLQAHLENLANALESATN